MFDHLAALFEALLFGEKLELCDDRAEVVVDFAVLAGGLTKPLRQFWGVTLHKIVVAGDEEAAETEVSLSPRAASELSIDTA